MSQDAIEALIEEKIIEDAVTQEVSSLSGDVYPIPQVTFEAYCVRIRSRPEVPFVLDAWQIDLCKRLETSFWCANARKFQTKVCKVKTCKEANTIGATVCKECGSSRLEKRGLKEVNIGTGEPYMVMPNGFRVPKAEFVEREDHGIQAAIHAPPQFGKEISHETPVFTTRGWSTHGALEPGDHVFGRNGQSVAVLAESPEVDSQFMVEFSDKSRIKCHGNHEWRVFDRRGHRPVERTVETKWLAQQQDLWLGPRHKRGGRGRFQVDANVQVHFPPCDLPLPPYILGAWLGDGTHNAGVLTRHRNDAPITKEFETLGFAPSQEKSDKNTGVIISRFPGLIARLKKIGVFGNKHIPSCYLTASKVQRLELLAGLIDTDGSVYQPNGRVQFTNTNEELIEDVRKLVVSLGWRVAISEVPACLSSSGIQGTKSTYQLCFNPTEPFPTRLERKRIRKINPQRRRRSIVAVHPLAPHEQTKGKCIEVEGGTYLVGATLIPTHNSSIISVLYPAWIMGFDPLHRFRLATYNIFHSAKFSKSVLHVLRSPEHKAIFPDPKGHLPTKTKYVEWSTNARVELNDAQPSFIAMGLDSGFVGSGADTLLQDDPYRSAEKARSPKIRDTTWRFQEETAKPRLREYSNNFIMFHRYSNDDQAGRALATGQWELWRYAAIEDGIYEDETTGLKWECLPVGRAPGGYLSARYPKHYYDQQKYDPHGNVTDVWNSQFMGMPTAKEGTFFDITKLVVITATEFENLTMFADVRAWDNASTPKDGDFTAGGRVSIDAMKRLFLTNMKRQQVDTAGRQQMQALAAHEDGLRVPIHFPQDPASAGKDVAFFFRQEYEPAGYTVIINPITGSKTARADEFSKVVNGGRFYLVVNDETHDNYLSPEQIKHFKTELRDFPLVGIYDDQVDCVADAVNYLLKLFLKGRVIKVNGDNNVLPWSRFMDRFGPRIPGDWEAAFACRIAPNSTLPSGFALVVRAAENSKLGETLFIPASCKKYVNDPAVILNDMREAAKIYLVRGVDQIAGTYIAHGNNATVALALEKFDMVLNEFEGDESLGLPETAYYFQPLKRPNPFYKAGEPQALGKGASRCYILSDDRQVENATDEFGQLSLRQDMMNWSYNDEGKPQPFGGIVLDCVRMTLYNFWLSATALTDDEKRMAKLPAHLQPEALQSKVGTQQFVSDFLAQQIELGRIHQEEKREQQFDEQSRRGRPRFTKRR